MVAGSELGGSDSVIASANGGAAWTPLAANAAALHTSVAGPGGDPWWLAGQPDYLLGGAKYTVSMVADAGAGGGGCGPQALLASGRSGIWRTPDAGADWYPAVAGLGVTINAASPPIRCCRAGCRSPAPTGVT